MGLLLASRTGVIHVGFSLRRTDLQKLSQHKVDDAKLLLSNGRFSNAYHLLGYGIELALKACIARTVEAETIPNIDVLKNFLSHDFDRLVSLAGLRVELADRQRADPDFAANWAIVKEWSPEKRYEWTDATSTQVMLESMLDTTTGVLSWLQRHW